MNKLIKTILSFSFSFFLISCLGINEDENLKSNPLSDDNKIPEVDSDSLNDSLVMDTSENLLDGSLDEFKDLSDLDSALYYRTLDDTLQPWFENSNVHWVIGPVKEMKSFENGKMNRKMVFNKRGGKVYSLYFDDGDLIDSSYYYWENHLPSFKYSKSSRKEWDYKKDSNDVNVKQETYTLDEWAYKTTSYSAKSNTYVSYISVSSKDSTEGSWEYINKSNIVYILRDSLVSDWKIDPEHGWWLGEEDGWINGTQMGGLYYKVKKDSENRIIELYGPGWVSEGKNWSYDDLYFRGIYSEHDKYNNFTSYSWNRYDSLGNEINSINLTYEYEYWK